MNAVEANAKCCLATGGHMDQTGRFLSSIIHRRWTAVNGFSVAADRLTAIAAAWIFDSFRERARYPRPELLAGLR